MAPRRDAAARGKKSEPVTHQEAQAKGVSGKPAIASTSADEPPTPPTPEAPSISVRSLIDNGIDFAVCALVMSNSMGRLWEQDVWWQLRLGDEIVFHGKGFPEYEEWTYTSSDVPFHNHWWLCTILFSLVYHYAGGVAALVALRGIMCGILAKLLLMLRPRRPERWLLAALAFRISKHRLQFRPELLCLDFFAALPILRQSLERADCRRAAHSVPSLLWPKEVLCMYACVVVAANLHFGVAPWPVLFCGTLLADDLFDTAAVAARVWRWLPWINLTAFARAAPVVFLILINPQPLAGLGYILHHRPGKYMTEKKLKNPEHRSLMDEFSEYRATEKLAFFSTSTLRHVPWIVIFFALALIGPLLWLLTRRKNRLAGLRSPFFVFLSFGVMTYLVYDRTRTVVWPACFLVAMFGTGRSEVVFQSNGTWSMRSFLWNVMKNYLWPLLCLAAACGVIAGDYENPDFRLGAFTWPVRSTEFVRSRNLTGRVYHTITFGGYIAYWLPNNQHFADPREYCFRHLDALYAAVHLDSVRLNRDILEKYGIDIFIALIPKTQPLPMGGFDDVAGRFLDKGTWARVYFDHVSEIFLRRTVPQFRKLIADMEVKTMIPAFPPDYHVRVLLGREKGNVRGLLIDLERCLERRELYCMLIEALRASATAREGDAHSILQWLNTLEAIDPALAKDERVFTRQYLESTKIHLRRQLGIHPQDPRALR